MKHTFFAYAIVFFLILISLNAIACGCGMALAPPEVFNSMKESRAYLVVDVEGPNSFTEKVFFRFVSFDEEYNVKMVFPMKELPTGVDGEKLSIKEFLDKEKISLVKEEEKKQNLNSVLEAIRRPLIWPALLFGTGALLPILAIPIFMVGSPAGSAGGPIAHYTFEGGELDIYDVSSKQTLDALVEELGFEAEGKVKELVDKYKDYYVAVMTLEVPTVLPESDMTYLKSNCNQEFEKAKQVLQTKPTIQWSEIDIDPWKADDIGRRLEYEDWHPLRTTKERVIQEYGCEGAIVMLVASATNPGSDVKGVMVSMSYNSNEVFYPTSIVNSYTYPVTDQSYYVKTPLDLQFSPKSNVAGAVLFDNKRWYLVKDTATDLEGTIETATAQTKAGDSWLAALKVAYENAGWITLALLIAIIALVVYFTLKLPKNEWPTGKDLTFFVIFGVFIGSIIAFSKGKKRFAVIVIVAWLAMLLAAVL